MQIATPPPCVTRESLFGEERVFCALSAPYACRLKRHAVERLKRTQSAVTR